MENDITNAFFSPIMVSTLSKTSVSNLAVSISIVGQGSWVKGDYC